MPSVTESADIALKLVKEAPVISYDTESSGTDWKRNYPIGYVVAARDGDRVISVYVPVRHGGGGNLPGGPGSPPEGPAGAWQGHPFEQALARAFKDRQRRNFKTVGHHIKFDCHMSASAGIMLGRNLSDTQNYEAMLDEYARHYSLEASAERRGVTAKKGAELYQHLANQFGGPADRTSMQHYWKTSGADEVAVDYAAGDGVSTLELYEKQLPLLAEGGIRDAVVRMEDRLTWTLFRMERRGIKIDEEYLAKTKEYIEQQLVEAQAKLPSDFNVLSPTQTKKWMEAQGVTNWPTTDAGNPSFPEKFLKKSEAGRTIVAVRKWSHMLSKFIVPLMEEHIFKGRVHATLNQLKNDDMGTPARLSCSGPNLQAVPKRDKVLAKLFRRAFVADEGYLMYEDDYSQCEPRLFAHYSKDPNLTEGYTQMPFRDVHQVVADLLGVERDPTAKRMNMGIFTGMFPKAFAEHMDWPIDKATEKWNAWFEAFPGIKDFQGNAKEQLMSRGWVKTILGRIAHLEHPRYAYRAVSKIIQGGNADILKYKMVEIDEWIESEGDLVHMLMTIHDAFEGQFPYTPEGRAAHDKMLAMMVDVQGPPFNLRVPFAVDSGIGYDWATATFGDNK